jgi:hypothetical protein
MDKKGEDIEGYDKGDKEFDKWVDDALGDEDE